jgi:hypothetical protein
MIIAEIITEKFDEYEEQINQHNTLQIINLFNKVKQTLINTFNYKIKEILDHNYPFTLFITYSKSIKLSELDKAHLIYNYFEKKINNIEEYECEYKSSLESSLESYIETKSQIIFFKTFLDSYYNYLESNKINIIDNYLKELIILAEEKIKRCDTGIEEKKKLLIQQYEYNIYENYTLKDNEKYLKENISPLFEEKHLSIQEKNKILNIVYFKK